MHIYECIRACRQTRAAPHALRNRKNQYYRRGFAGRASPPAPRLGIAPAAAEIVFPLSLSLSLVVLFESYKFVNR